MRIRNSGLLRITEPIFAGGFCRTYLKKSIIILPQRRVAPDPRRARRGPKLGDLTPAAGKSKIGHLAFLLLTLSTVSVFFEPHHNQLLFDFMYL